MTRWISRLSSMIMVCTLVGGLVIPVGVSAQTISTKDRYVALGDSIAAGVGLPVRSTLNEDVQCGRSKQAYPYKVAKQQKLALETYACSGATAFNGLYTSQTQGSGSLAVTLAPQLDAAFASGVPKVITITVGANDAGWLNIIKQCYATNIDCTSGIFDAQAVAGRLNQRTWLYTVLGSIYVRSNGKPPKVILTGYYNPLSTAKTCSDTTGLTTNEITWLNDQEAKLNQTISNAAVRTNKIHPYVSYAPVDFTGHELCSAKPWVQGLTAKAPYHPTAAGQTAIAKAVATQL